MSKIRKLIKSMLHLLINFHGGRRANRVPFRISSNSREFFPPQNLTIRYYFEQFYTRIVLDGDSGDLPLGDAVSARRKAPGWLTEVVVLGDDNKSHLVFEIT